MTRSAPIDTLSRLAACIAVAGFLCAAPALAQTQLPPPAFGQADSRQDRIEELEGQLRDATAENERLQNQLTQAQREVQRLRGMVGELSSVNQSLQTAPPAQEGGGAAEYNQPALAVDKAVGQRAQQKRGEQQHGTGTDHHGVPRQRFPAAQQRQPGCRYGDRNAGP